MIHTWFEFVQQSVGGGNIGLCMCVGGSVQAWQWASSPAVIDVTVHLCVSRVWTKSITESKKPNATNHVRNNSPTHSFSLSLSLSLAHGSHPGAQYQCINILIQVRGC